MRRALLASLLAAASIAPPALADDEAAEPSAGDEAAPAEDDGDEPSLGVDLHGYYRVRAHAVRNMLFAPGETDPSPRYLTYLTQRLRLEPEVGYGDLVKLHVTIDGLDDVVWGDNAGLASTALFANEPSSTGVSGSERPYVFLRRAWIDVTLPIGMLRVGRQPSDWGLGLLTNGGDGFDDDFGDNRYGSTNDRILFATKPISIGRAIAGLDPGDTPLILAVAFDKLVEEPLAEGRTRPNYDSAWLADNDDDVDEWIFILAWKQDPAEMIAPDDGISAGVYFVWRDQPSTYSNVYILDGFFKLRLAGFFAEGEALWITGTSQAIPLSPEVDPVRHLYEEKEADILGWLVRAGWRRGIWTVKVESGYASGDGNWNDRDFTGRALNPDVNVGLIMYEELFAEWTRAAWKDKESMWSQGGVYDSYYLMVTGIIEPIPRLQVTLGVLSAWADEADGSILLDTGWLGTEIDISVRYRFAGEHVLAVLEGGWLRPANGPFGLETYELANTDLWTLQSRVAFVY